MSLPSGTEELLLLHNPKCSKSRALHAALEERGLAFRVRRYLDEPLDAAELIELFGALGRPGSEVVRTKEEAYADSGLEADSDDDAVAAALAAVPKLLERPILVRGRRAAVGRPTEDALALLEDRG